MFIFSVLSMILKLSLLISEKGRREEGREGEREREKLTAALPEPRPCTPDALSPPI